MADDESGAGGIPASIPGMQPGETARNVVLAVTYGLASLFIIFKFRFFFIMISLVLLAIFLFVGVQMSIVGLLWAPLLRSDCLRSVFRYGPTRNWVLNYAIFNFGYNLLFGLAAFGLAFSFYGDFGTTPVLLYTLLTILFAAFAASIVFSKLDEYVLTKVDNSDRSTMRIHVLAGTAWYGVLIFWVWVGWVLFIIFVPTIESGLEAPPGSILLHLS